MFDSNIREILQKSLLVFFVNTRNADTKVDMVTMTGKVVTVPPSVARTLESHKHKWSIMLAVFYIDNGKHTCSFLMAEANKPRLQSEMVDDLNTEHQAFIESVKDQGLEVLGAGWIASPAGLDLSENLCGDIFDKLGAFDYEY